MSTYLITQRARKNYAGSPDPAATAAAVVAWFERMGTHLVARSNPASEKSTLGNCGTDTEPFGYTLVTADDREAAVALAGGCPILAHGGGVEVRELTDAPLDTQFSGFAPQRRPGAAR